MHLFFGCRNERQDYLYQGKLCEFRREGTLTTLHTAFSRDQAAKVYVQHRLKEQAALVRGVVAGGGFIYVCGDGAHMARDVHAALIDILAADPEVPRDHAEAETVLKDLAARARYVR
eukprot:g5747.t1